MRSLKCLLQSVHLSGITCVHISDSCVIQKNSRANFCVVDHDIIDKVVLSKLFCASSQMLDLSDSLLPSLLTSKTLDLSQECSYGYFPAQKKIHSDLVQHIFTSLEYHTFVSELIFTGNSLCMSNIVGSAIQHLLSTTTCTLQTLKLENCEIEDSVCECIAMGLANNLTLKVLDLSQNSFTTTGSGKLIQSLNMNSSLQELDLSANNHSTNARELGSQLGVDIQNVLAKNKTLSALRLDSSIPLSKHIAVGLCRNKAIRVLSLYSVKEEELIIKIFQSIEHNNSLEELDISYSSVKTIPIGSAIQLMLGCNTVLKNMILQHCRISDEVCKVITAGLAQNKTLLRLNLSENEICGSGMMALFELLEENTCCLQELNLSSNWKYPRTDVVKPSEIIDKTILKTNSTLLVLMVSDFHYFSEWLGSKLFEGLKQNSTLHELDIGGNFLDHETSHVFLDMISHNKAVTKLSIRYCQISVPWNLNLAEILSNSSLQEVIVDPVTINLYESIRDKVSISTYSKHFDYYKCKF